MILTTTPGVEGRRVTAYLGIVSGEAIMGANLFRDFFASIRDIVGGRAGAYEQVIEDAKRAALADMQAQAAELNADAVVGIDLDYEVIGGTKAGMLMVSVNGTAVRLG